MRINKTTRKIFLSLLCLSILFVCVSAAFDFSVTKSSTNDQTIHVGDIVNYVINITNNGTTNITSILINDTFNSTLLHYNSSSTIITSNGTGWIYWNLTNATSGIPIVPSNYFEIYVNMTASVISTNVNNSISINITDNSSQSNFSISYDLINISHSCGDLISENTVLTSDLNNCSSTGLTINESNITLDCNGYSINSNNNIGINIDQVNNITLSNCNIINFGYGILLNRSINITLVNNSIINSSIYIEGNSINYWNTHTLNNNSLNGNPIYYWKDNSSGTVSSDAGQIILANCTNITIEDQNINNVSTNSIVLGFSNNNTLKNNYIDNNYDIAFPLFYFTVEGIYLFSSNSNLISNNTLINGWNEISLENSHNNTLVNLTMNSSLNGIYIFNSTQNNITNIDINNSYTGIELYYANSTNINNIISNNGAYGVFLLNSSYNNLTNITANNNGNYGIFLWTSNYNNLLNNSVSSNNISGFYIYSSSNNNSFLNNSACSNEDYDFYFDSDSNGNTGSGTCDNLTDLDSNTIRCYWYCNGDPTFELNFTLSKTSLYSSYNLTETIEYEINITNNEIINLTEIRINDTFNSSYLDYSSSSVANTSAGNGWLYWHLNSSTSGVPITPNSTFTLYVNMSALKTGNNVNNSIDVNCTDSLSTTNTSSTSVSVNLSDVISPAVNILTSSQVTSNTTPTIMFNYTDSHDATANCTLYFNGTSYGTNSSTLNNTLTNITATTVAHGNYTVYINCTDLSGNTNKSSEIWIKVQHNMNVTSVYPNNTTVAISTFDVNYSVNIPATCTLKLWNTSNSSVLLINGTSNTTNNSHSITKTLINGNYSWNISCQDLLNSSNEYANNYSFVLNDSTAPTISNISGNGTEYDWDTDSVTITLITNENASCKYSNINESYNQLGAYFDNESSVMKLTHTATISVNSGDSCTEYIRCRDINSNANSVSEEISFSVDSNPVADDSPSSGGGGGSGSDDSSSSQTNMWGSLSSGETGTMEITNDNIKLNSIEFTVAADLRNIEIKVTKSDSRDEATINPPGKSLHYLEIDTTNLDDSDITEAEINFRVDKSWITDNNIDENKIYLYRWANDKWNKLETTLLTKGSSEYSYRAISPGFSEFAISGEETFTVNEDVTDDEEPQESNDSESSSELISAQVGDAEVMDWKLVLSLVILVGIIAGAIMHYYFNVYKKY